ncbi:hypothetical protein V5049_09320 [Moellerella wisconsensis]|uniref:hypothetical protein n=1 Tax=Moellerella wisconsensis TaxID=158849 RepID=UPI001F4E0981|nr:hypothetical protein [Moellerella wisconsensis]UNH25419.1 hypothetical protein MNY68_06835 [Moellerella wisconsensis]
MKNKNISDFQSLSAYICDCVKNSSLCKSYDLQNNANRLDITLYLDQQNELRVELRSSFLGEKSVFLLLIRNDSHWNKVTRIYLVPTKSHSWRILYLKKHNCRYRSLFFKRNFNHNIFNSYLSDFE